MACAIQAYAIQAYAMQWCARQAYAMQWCARQALLTRGNSIIVLHLAQDLEVGIDEGLM